MGASCRDDPWKQIVLTLPQILKKLWGDQVCSHPFKPWEVGKGFPCHKYATWKGSSDMARQGVRGQGQGLEVAILEWNFNT